MNPKVKKKWLKALKSGDYVQGQERLLAQDKNEKSKKRYCCLGVLGDLYCKRKSVECEWVSVDKKDKTSYKLSISSPDNHLAGSYLPTQYLPNEVLWWAGIDRNFENELSLINDESVNFKKAIKAIKNHDSNSTD